MCHEIKELRYKLEKFCDTFVTKFRYQLITKSQNFMID